MNCGEWAISLRYLSHRLGMAFMTAQVDAFDTGNTVLPNCMMTPRVVAGSSISTCLQTDGQLIAPTLKKSWGGMVAFVSSAHRTTTYFRQYQGKHAAQGFHTLILASPTPRVVRSRNCMGPRHASLHKCAHVIEPRPLIWTPMSTLMHLWQPGQNGGENCEVWRRGEVSTGIEETWVMPALLQCNYSRLRTRATGS